MEDPSLWNVSRTSERSHLHENNVW